MEKQIYLIPKLEVLEVHFEKGFAQSQDYEFDGVVDQGEEVPY